VLYQQWYKKVEGKNVQILPMNIAELLTPRAIAYWLAGDAIWINLKGVLKSALTKSLLMRVELLRGILLEKLDPSPVGPTPGPEAPPGRARGWDRRLGGPLGPRTEGPWSSGPGVETTLLLVRNNSYRIRSS